MIRHNPVIGTKRLKVNRRGFHTWTDIEIAQYRAHWPLGTFAHAIGAPMLSFRQEVAWLRRALAALTDIQ